MQTSQELIQLTKRLRSADPDERLNAAEVLSEVNTKEAVEALIQMAGGGRRRFLSYYSLDDQLIAIECIGNTGRVEALEFLRRLYTPKIYEERRYRSTAFGSDTINDEWNVKCHSYPCAFGSLAKALYYEVDITTSTWGSESARSDSVVAQDREKKLNESPAHKVICDAIRKLEESLSNA